MDLHQFSERAVLLHFGTKHERRQEERHNLSKLS
jgi:hypothetical protein